MDVVADTRNCVHCGAAFTPRREHARFCSPKCRVTWNRQRAGQVPTAAGALDWSITAMQESTDLLLKAEGWDLPPAFTAITEAVWWVTMVDATLVRYHPDAYGAVLASHDAAQRKIIEDTFAGLRFVRNRMGYKADPDAFIRPKLTRSGPAAGRIAAWTWRPVRKPALASLPPRGQEWELTRFRAYRAQLAGHAIGDTFGQAVTFLRSASGVSVSHA
jgi:predicted nucleic acid-binding Zn ribbon protein